MGKRRGGKHKAVVRNGLGDIPIFLELYREMCENAEGESEFGYIEQFCTQNYCKRMLEMFSHLPLEDVHVMCSTPGEPWFNHLKADIGGSRFWTDEQISQFILATFEKCKKGETFVRKLLFIYWMLKIENDTEFKEALKKVFKENATVLEREAKLKQISNQFYGAEDFDKMSPAEMEWYCSTFNIMDEKAARPKFLKEMLRMSNAKMTNVPVKALGQCQFLRQMLDRSVELAMEKALNDLDLSSQKELKAELDEARSKLHEANTTVDSMTKGFEEKDKEIEGLMKQLEEKQATIKDLDKQLVSLTKKPLTEFVTLAHDELLLKCLQLAADARSTESLGERVLRSLNYDDEVVDMKRKEVTLRIDGHLNSVRDQWNAKFLKGFANKWLSGGTKTPVEFANDLLKLKKSG